MQAEIVHNCRMRPIVERKTQLGQALTIHRERLGLTLPELADALNEFEGTDRHTKNSVGRWERDGAIGKANRELLCAFYSITEAELFKPRQRGSIDAMLEGKPEQAWLDTQDFVRRYVLREAPDNVDE